MSTRTDKNLVVGIYAIPEGCWCFDDPVQALCLQHTISAQSNGPIYTIVSRVDLDPARSRNDQTVE